MHRRIKRVERALSLKTKRKVSLSNEIPLPKPQFEFEDALVAQLRATDVLANCVDGSEHQIQHYANQRSPKNLPTKRHPYYYDSSLVPVWQAFYNLDKKAKGTVLVGRLTSFTSLVGSILNPRHLNEKMVEEHSTGASQIAFSDYKSFIESCVERNVLAFAIEWQKLRSICWSQCETWHLQALPFEIQNGNVPQDLYHSLFWLWCIFNQLVESDTYPPSADGEEVELVLRKLFSSIGIIWEEHDDNLSSVSSSSLSMHNGVIGSSSVKLHGGSSTRIFEEDKACSEELPVPVTENLMVTFQQFLSIIAEMLGSETVHSTPFQRAVKQIYLSEVDEIIKTSWMHLKKPGTDTWKRRWVVLRQQNLEFYADPLCEVIKYQITLNHKMHVESIPDSSTHRHRFRLVEREGDFSIAWEAEMSCSDVQHSHSWMLILNLSIKVQPAGLSAKKIELANRRLERHRRRESEWRAFDKRREMLATRKKLQEVREECEGPESNSPQGSLDPEERWNLMQTRLSERAEARDKAMNTVQKMDEIYDKLQSITKKQSLVKKSKSKIRSAFPSFSSDSGIEMTRDEKILLKTRQKKLTEQREKMLRLEEDEKKLQDQLLELQAMKISEKYSDETLITIYGAKKESNLEQETHGRQSSIEQSNLEIVCQKISKHRAATSPMPYREDTGSVSAVSISSASKSPYHSPHASFDDSFASSQREHESGHVTSDSDDITTKPRTLSSTHSYMYTTSSDRLV